MIFIIFGTIILGLYTLDSQKSEPIVSVPDYLKPNEDFLTKFTDTQGLDDVAPEAQGGSFSSKYDDAFVGSRNLVGVSAMILKAHAIRESSLKSQAFRQEPDGVRASYGLMQILWWKNSNRFAKYGYSDDTIGDGSLLYDPQVNTEIAAKLWLDNWNSCKNLRDTINMYNTGVKESVRKAPGNYVDDVLKYYSTLIGRQIT